MWRICWGECGFCIRLSVAASFRFRRRVNSFGFCCIVNILLLNIVFVFVVLILCCFYFVFLVMIGSIVICIVFCFFVIYRRLIASSTRSWSNISL